jgi:hypothetical protein
VKPVHVVASPSRLGEAGASLLCSRCRDTAVETPSQNLSTAVLRAADFDLPARGRLGSVAFAEIAFVGLLGMTLLAGCQSAPKDYVEIRAPQDPVTVASHIADNIGTCWFSGKRSSFADYSYAPELTSYSNRPRVLIVPKNEPHGLPQLVVEASAAKRGTSVKLFGPMLASGEAAAIHADVARWAGGASGC